MKEMSHKEWFNSDIGLDETKTSFTVKKGCLLLLLSLEDSYLHDPIYSSGIHSLFRKVFLNFLYPHVFEPPEHFLKSESITSVRKTTFSWNEFEGLETINYPYGSEKEFEKLCFILPENDSGWTHFIVDSKNVKVIIRD